MSRLTACYACEQEKNFETLPPRERIAVDDAWRVAHAINTALPGWLVLLPRRHVVAIAELTGVEAAGLGAWQVRLSQALHAVTGCAKTYMVAFGEAEGFSHLHFHVVPRMAELAEDLRGPGVFGLLGRVADEQVSAVDMNEFAIVLRRHLPAGSVRPRQGLS
jgi:diadenosine tetraphosphate (Ap4A) HIT family hydrolase